MAGVNTRMPCFAYYVVVAVWVVACIGAAFLWSARYAVYGLAAGMVVGAVARALAPEGAVARIRSRWLDVATLLAFAFVLTFLARFASTPPVL